MSMTIDLNVLDPASIDAAIDDLKRAEKQLNRYVDRGLERSVIRAKHVAEQYLREAQFAGPGPDAYVAPGVWERENGVTSAELSMFGDHAGIVEFGSGIAYGNDYQEFYGYYPGSYNPGSPYATQPWGWFYTGPPGRNPPEGTEPADRHRNTTHTYGSPPNMVMWKTANDDDLHNAITDEFRDLELFYD